MKQSLVSLFVPLPSPVEPSPALGRRFRAIGLIAGASFVAGLALGFASGCSGAPEDAPDLIDLDEGAAQAGTSIVVGSRPPSRILLDPAQRALAHTLAESAIAAERLSPGIYVLSPAAVAATATDGGRQWLTMAIACAFPADVTLVPPGGSPGDPLSFFGEVGLAPRWLRDSLSAPGRAWVTSCLLSRISGTDLAIVVSLRGAHPILAFDPSERDAWHIEEGAFFGDLFANQAGPPLGFACRGEDGDAAVAAGRVCAEEDPGHPGLTRCGFLFAGACQDACARKRRGAYRGCRVPGSPGVAANRAVTDFLAE